MTDTRHSFRGAASLVAALLLALIPSVALACAIDDTASLSANGVRATLNSTLSSNASAATWAPFTIGQAFAVGTPIVVTESQAELARTLTPDEVAAPYRWSFGDGGVARGHAVTHRYAGPGFYRVVVSTVTAKSKTSLLFDSVLLHIVPPDQTLQANLGYFAARLFDDLMSGLLWIMDGALVALVLAVVWRRQRRVNSTPASR